MIKQLPARDWEEINLNGSVRCHLFLRNTPQSLISIQQAPYFVGS
jgi:hypothetical protein